jgi:hypothetical protein
MTHFSPHPSTGQEFSPPIALFLVHRPRQAIIRLITIVIFRKYLFFSVLRIFHILGDLAGLPRRSSEREGSAATRPLIVIEVYIQMAGTDALPRRAKLFAKACPLCFF